MSTSPSSGKTSVKEKRFPFNVPEVEVENLSADAEPADDVGNFLTRILKALANRLLTEVQPVTRVLGGHEAL